MPIVNTPSLEQASVYTDLNSLDTIRRQGRLDEDGAIKRAAKEFEAFFLNMMLKSMRQASQVIGEDSPLFSQQEKMFTSMLDEQLSVNLSQGGHLKIADLMYAQLTGHQGKRTDSLPLSQHLSNARLRQADPVAIKPAESVQINAQINDMQELIQHIELQTGSATGFKAPIEAESLKTEQPKTQPKTDSKPFKAALFEKAQDFIEQLMPLAKKAASKLNLDPRVLVAQAALETGWGKFIMHDQEGNPGFNLFGIKANNNWQGKAIHIDTLEVENQQFKKVSAAFRQYQNFEQSFEDFINFIQSNPRYHKAVEVAEDTHQFVNQLQDSGYATDPKYAQKILRIFNNQQLQQIVPSTNDESSNIERE